jgi:hypothetical protein
MTLHDSNHPDRRLFLKGALGAAGTVLAGPALRAADPSKHAKACIVLWMSGGPSQIDTFDMKPDAPVEIRGEYKSIPTTARGLLICEHLPHLAKHGDKLTVIRSMNTISADHTGATIRMLTGYAPDPLGLKYPWLGSVVAKYKGDPKSPLPGCVSLGEAHLQPDEGFLGPAYQPMRLAALKDAPEGKMKKLCDVSTEWEKYGKVYGDSDLGRNCLAARRLVEAGVPFVQVNHGGYDMHANLFPMLKTRLGQLDPAWAGLLQDLGDRGLLSSTLVVWMGEFGRTPRINANAGRDHWPRGFSVVLAGGRVKGGVAHGETETNGSGVKEKPVTEGELLATVYTGLGIDPKATNMAGVKAVPLTPEKSEPIKEVLQ